MVQIVQIGQEVVQIGLNELQQSKPDPKQQQSSNSTFRYKALYLLEVRLTF